VVDQVIAASSISAGNLIYTPGASPTGSAYASFGFSVVDSDGSSALQTQSFTFNYPASNTPPSGTLQIVGTARVGQTLTANSSLTDANGMGTIGYQWLAGGVAISNATASSFLITSGQLGKAITLRAAYTDGLGTEETVTSAATALVSIVLTGTTAGETLTGGAEATPTTSMQLAMWSRSLPVRESTRLSPSSITHWSIMSKI
jgi:hypothetical protein